jgi:hypothetical protein
LVQDLIGIIKIVRVFEGCGGYELAQGVRVVKKTV